MDEKTTRAIAHENANAEALSDTLALIAHAHYVADRNAVAPERITGDAPIGYLTGCCSIAEDLAEWGEEITEVDLDTAERAVCAAYRELREASPADELASSYTIRDPFCGHIKVSGRTIEDAVADAYEDIGPEERPTYVWYGDERVEVPGGSCTPEC